MPTSSFPARPALILFFGVFCGSSAVIFIKANSDHPSLIATYRLLLASAFLFPLYLKERRDFQGEYGWRQIGWSALPGIMLAVHFITWAAGVHLTKVSNASLIVNMTPAAMPFFLWIFYGERINRREMIGTLVALTGLGVLAASRLIISLESALGDLVCFFSMLCFAAYLALGRRNSGRLPLWLYMVPLYFIAGVACLVSAIPLVNPLKPYLPMDVILFFALALIPTVIGHTILNYSMKHFRGQIVGIANLGQIIFATILGFLIFSDAPHPAFYPAAALIVTGVLIAISSGYKKQEINENKKEA